MAVPAGPGSSASGRLESSRTSRAAGRNSSVAPGMMQNGWEKTWTTSQPTTNGRAIEMPIYEYKCSSGHRVELGVSREESGGWQGRPCFESIVVLCETGGTPEEPKPYPVNLMRLCREPLKRSYGSVQFAAVPQAEFNRSLGREISDPRQFESECRRASEKAFLKTGIEHDYQPIDPKADMED